MSPRWREGHQFAVDAACDHCGVMLSELVQGMAEDAQEIRPRLSALEACANRLRAVLNQIKERECNLQPCPACDAAKSARAALARLDALDVGTR